MEQSHFPPSESSAVTTHAAPAPSAGIGKYTVHPVAAMFPMMSGRPLRDLLNDIAENGQLDPIVLEGDVLLDGRNRLAVCETLGITPKTVQWADIAPKGVEVFYWIFAKNMERRHLTDDQRVAIGAEFHQYQDIVGNQRGTQFKPGKSGNPSGKAKEQAHPKSGEPARDARAEHARSTAGRLAESVGTSRYKAEMAIKLADAAKTDPEAAAELEEVKQGNKKLCQAMANEDPADKPDDPPPSRTEKRAAEALRLKAKLDVSFHRFMRGYPKWWRSDFIAQIRRLLEQEEAS